MSNHNNTFNAFIALGDFLKNFCGPTPTDSPAAKKLSQSIQLAGHKNGWFTKENVVFALKAWGDLLTNETLSAWLSNYDLTTKSDVKTVAIIMAGNIPLVGFHDFLAVLMTGNKVLIKLSANDNVLISFIANYLISIDKSFQERIELSKGQLKGFDGVIATGSNNTARYFEHYFGKGPNIIRKNKNSVAVLSGNETKEQLNALGEDIFRYYGLGCRSVSKFFVPDGYNFDIFFNAIYNYGSIVNQVKYANNYDYNKAVYLMSEFKLLDNGFLILKQDASYSSPIASLFYEFYTDKESLRLQLERDHEQLQCVVSDSFIKNEVAFGQTQLPSLTDYADGIDTVDFLLKI